MAGPRRGPSGRNGPYGALARQIARWSSVCGTSLCRRDIDRTGVRLRAKNQTQKGAGRFRASPGITAFIDAVSIEKAEVQHIRCEWLRPLGTHIWLPAPDHVGWLYIKDQFRTIGLLIFLRGTIFVTLIGVFSRPFRNFTSDVGLSL
jgi:hypothetical protein